MLRRVPLPAGRPFCREPSLETLEGKAPRALRVVQAQHHQPLTQGLARLGCLLQPHHGPSPVVAPHQDHLTTPQPAVVAHQDQLGMGHIHVSAFCRNLIPKELEYRILNNYKAVTTKHTALFISYVSMYNYCWCDVIISLKRII